MSMVRLAALAIPFFAAGCYTDAAPQSTLPEPQYVAGPPGGGMDPGYATSPYAAPTGAAMAPAAAMAPGAAADPSEDPDDVDDAAPPDSTPPADAPVGAAPAGPGAPGSPDDVAQAGGPPGAPGDPTATVSDDEIDNTLDGYGQWIDTDDYGQVWRPDATVVGVDFTPYESGGSWAYTDAGWAFSCDYPWGWLPFHYGRWAWFRGYWAWVPGHRWGPAWVQWRHGGGVVGWRPLPPGRGSSHRWHGGNAPFRDHRRAAQHDAHWRFATTTDFGRPHIRAHLYRNPAEGLRVTSAVAAPPVRGTTTFRSADLMRNRFAAGRLGQPGPGRGFGPAQVRDHRTAPTRTYQPPVRTYQPPARTYQPPAQAYRAPVYQPPARTYQPPARTYQPPAQSYRPPVYQAPARTYQPPVRTYQAPVHTSPPPSAPSHSGSWSSGGSSHGGSWSSGGSSHGSSSSSGSSSHGSSSSGSSSSNSSSSSSSHGSGGGHRR
jgi:hypothetical protein